MSTETKRDSNFELLRVILMIMIIILHYCNPNMGGALGNVVKGTINYYLAHFIESACIIAVNVFIIITGYFMTNKREIKISKVLKLFYLSLLYGILIFLVCVLTNRVTIDLFNIKKCIYTITDRWFVVIYSILYLMIPYINKLIHSIDQKQFKILLAILIIFFYIWPTFWTTITVNDSGYGILNFVTLYLIGAYIRLYCNELKSFSKSSVIYLICTIATTIFSLYSGKAFRYNSILNLISAVAVFEMFKAINIKNSTIINKLASFTFSTYIIHENSFIVESLYRKIFKTVDYYHSNYFVFNLIITTIGIYVICVIIEWIRRLIMEKYIDSKIEEINYKISV